MAVSTIKKKGIYPPTTFSFSQSWTAPADGILCLTVRRTAGSTGTVTWYIKDETASMSTLGAIAVSGVNGGYQNSVCIPVIRGHIYKEEYSSGVDLVYGKFFPIN